MVSASATAQIHPIAVYASDHNYESLRVSLDGTQLYGQYRTAYGQALDARNGQMIDASTGPTSLLSLEDQEYVTGGATLTVWDLNWSTRKREFSTGLPSGELVGVISEAKNRIFVARPKSETVVVFDSEGKYLKYLRRNGSITIPMQTQVRPFKNEKADQITVHRSVFNMTSMAYVGEMPGIVLAKSNDGSRYLCRTDTGELLLVRASDLETIWSKAVKSEGGVGSAISFLNAEFVEHDEFILALSSDYTDSGQPQTVLLRFDLQGTQVATPFYAFPISDSRARFATNPVSRRVYLTLPTTRFPGNPLRLTILSYSPGATLVKPYLTQITGNYDLKSPGRNRSEFEVAGNRAIDSESGRDVERPMHGEGEVAADSRNKVNRSGSFLEFTNITNGLKYSYQVPGTPYTDFPLMVVDSFTAICPVVLPGGRADFGVFRTDLVTTKKLGSVLGTVMLAPGNFGKFALQSRDRIRVYSYGSQLREEGSLPVISPDMWATM
jgi:hypothetical protein